MPIIQRMQKLNPFLLIGACLRAREEKAFQEAMRKLQIERETTVFYEKFENLFNLQGEELKTELEKLKQEAKSKNFDLVVQQKNDRAYRIELHRFDGGNKQVWYRTRNFDYWRFTGVHNKQFFRDEICDPRYPSGDGFVIFSGRIFSGGYVHGKIMAESDVRRLIHGPEYKEPEIITFPWWWLGACSG